DPKCGEHHEARDEEQPRGTDVATATAGEIFAGQESRAKQECTERLPEPAVERDVAAARLPHERDERRRTRSRFLPAGGAIIAGRRRAAVAAAERLFVHGFLRAMSWSIRATMPRKMLTSSFSRPARANRRRSRGRSFFGISGFRMRIATSVRSPCAYNASISSVVAGANRGARHTCPSVAATRR